MKSFDDLLVEHAKRIYEIPSRSLGFVQKYEESLAKAWGGIVYFVCPKCDEPEIDEWYSNDDINFLTPPDCLCCMNCDTVYSFEDKFRQCGSNS